MEDEDNDAPGKNGRRPVLLVVLTSQSFVEKATLLLLTVLLSGYMVPFLIARYNNEAAIRQKSEDLARSKNDAILQAQSKLLEDLSTVILTYETLALDVSWYKTPNGKDDGMYRKAYERYSERIVDLLSGWRSLIAKSQMLTSPAVSAKIAAFQLKVFEQQDGALVALNRNGGTPEQWMAQHNRSVGMLEEANGLISEIMSDLRLSRQYLR